MSVEQTVTPHEAGRARTWALGVIAGAFGLFYAYAVWNAVWNLLGSVQTFAAAGIPLNTLGWFLWIFAAVFPLIVFAVAFRLGYRRPLAHAALLMLVGLALVAVFWLNVVAYSLVNTHALIS